MVGKVWKDCPTQKETPKMEVWNESYSHQKQIGLKQGSLTHQQLSFVQVHKMKNKWIPIRLKYRENGEYHLDLAPNLIFNIVGVISNHYKPNKMRNAKQECKEKLQSIFSCYYWIECEYKVYDSFNTMEDNIPYTCIEQNLSIWHYQNLAERQNPLKLSIRRPADKMYSHVLQW